MSTPMDALFDNADLKCTACGTSTKTGCDCWVRCKKCGHNNLKDEKCRNCEAAKKDEKPVLRAIASGNFKL